MNRCILNVSSVFCSTTQSANSDLRSDPNHVLRVPHRPMQTIPKQTIQKVALYYSQVLGKRRVEIESHLPEKMSIWGKFRICGGGDAFRSSFAMKGKENQSYRNSSYVRVSTLQIYLDCALQVLKKIVRDTVWRPRHCDHCWLRPARDAPSMCLAGYPCIWSATQSLANPCSHQTVPNRWERCST
jgi:hypothetical protein